jgi:hypothetical protein
MATAALDATLGRLTQSVTARIANDERFKQNVYDTINRILSRLNECAAAVSSASSGPERAAAAVDLSRQVAALNAQIARLQSNQLNQADVDYVTNPLKVEAVGNNLKWDTSAKKRAFRPPNYTPGSGASAAPPYPGSSSGRVSGWPSSSSSRSPSLFDDDEEGLPLMPLTGPSPPAALDPSLRSSDHFASAIGHSGGWSPRRTPRRTPRRSPKKKTYRR